MESGDNTNNETLEVLFNSFNSAAYSLKFAGRCEAEDKTNNETFEVFFNSLNSTARSLKFPS